MTTDPEALLRAALSWAADDPDPETADEVRALVAARDIQAIRERFEQPLTFGTAGLRGIVGAGPGRMNRAVVIRATRAVGEFVVGSVADARTLPVVIGYDARKSSRAFAETAALVLAAMKIPVRLFSSAVPTPVVAHAVQKLAASAGIVITASHNPPEYNGYKLYASNGIQIVPPVDVDIEARIAAMGPANAIPRASESSRESLVTDVPPSLREAYLASIDAIRPRTVGDRNLGVVYTPLHGVGGKWALAALERAGFGRVAPVDAQMDPDGAFPTVSFPNPEEPAALALALELAEERGAELVLANDPDADRLAVAVPSASGRWIALTGNQIGVLLADFLLGHGRFGKPLVVSSVVSTPMVDSICRRHGARSERTLTGFKWIWTAALELMRSQGYQFAFGFEEAIGYSAGPAVRDKDGILAAVLFAELAAESRAAGQSVLERLEALYAEHGLWVSVQKSVVRAGVDGLEEIALAMDRLAASPPSELGKYPVVAVVDYRTGASERAPWLGTAAMIGLDLGSAGRLLVRPSGTEPKLKVYVDLRKEVERSRITAEEAQLAENARAIAAALLTSIGL